MAANRCFATFTPNQSASDYLNTSRQKTIFKEVNRNIIDLNTANPKKSNGFRYNSNFGVRSKNILDDKVGCLATAKNHQLLLDISKGKAIYNNQHNYCANNLTQTMDAPIFEAWSGNLYSVNYSNNNVVSFISPPNITASPTYCIVDPSHVLFNDNCPFTEMADYPPKWFSVVDISFNTTTYYKEANQAQILNGLYYPAQVTFGASPTPVGVGVDVGLDVEVSTDASPYISVAAPEIVPIPIPIQTPEIVPETPPPKK